MQEKSTLGFRIEAEIFSVGTWNEEHFTQADLQEISANFKRLKHQIKPPLKFGHDENQTLLGQSDGDPALGWVEALRVQGNKLLATFAGVPQVVYDAIKSRRYRRVSAEIYFNLRCKGRQMGKVLKAVALLGADLPAVTNLEDLTAFLSDGAHHSLRFGTLRVFTSLLSGDGITPLNEEDKQMESKQLAELESELGELRAYKETQQVRLQLEREQQRKQAFSTARGEVAIYCAQQQAAGRLSPALQEELIREIDKQGAAFDPGDALQVPFEWLRRFIASAPPLIAFGEVGHGASDGSIDKGENPSDALARQATARMIEMNLSYAQAAEYVLKTSPALAEAYRAYTLNPSKGE